MTFFLNFVIQTLFFVTRYVVFSFNVLFFHVTLDIKIFCL